MKSAAKKKVSIPTLKERCEGLLEELDAEIDRLAEEKRTPGVPAPVMRRLWEARALGVCLIHTYFEAIK